MFISCILFPFLFKKVSTHFPSTFSDFSVNIYFKMFYARKNFWFAILFWLVVKTDGRGCSTVFLADTSQDKKRIYLSTPHVLLDTMLYCILYHVMPNVSPAAVDMRGIWGERACSGAESIYSAAVTDAADHSVIPLANQALTSGRRKKGIFELCPSGQCWM